jgi:threonine aldolase
VIDLYSDTLTKPTPDMRRFMCEAEVGDEQKGEDPTVNLLQEMVADLLGKETAVFLPSGTMCNEIAVKVHTRPGDEVLADRTSHLIHFEAGGPGLLSGVLMAALDGERGVFTGAQVRAAMHPRSRYAPPTRLVSVENTSNLGGGRVWSLAQVEDVSRAARGLGVLATHMDGARLLNAVVARHPRAPTPRTWTRSGSTSARGSGAGARAAGSRASSRRRGATSRRWAAPCGRPASSRRAASTRSATT